MHGYQLVDRSSRSGGVFFFFDVAIPRTVLNDAKQVRFESSQLHDSQNE